MSPSYRSGEIAGYAYIIPERDADLGNLTLADYANASSPTSGVAAEDGGDSYLVVINGTLIRILFKKPFRDSDLNELLYVIIVIVFYATALMTLIITQIKRQRREGTDVEYYDEYLQRNSEVRKTCKTATSLVMKPGGAPSSTSTLTTNVSQSGVGVDAGRGSSSSASTALLLEPPSRARDVSPSRLSPRLGFGRGLGIGGVGVGEGDYVSYTPSPSPRELSPMLESIPDIGT